MITRLFLIGFFTVVMSHISLTQSQPTGLNVGQQAQDFTAKDQNGLNVNLYSQLRKGHVIVLFYRGNWCPYCNRQLAQLQDSLYLLEIKGASIIAITPEEPAGVRNTIDKTKAAFTIVHDEGLRIMRSYAVAYDVEESVVKRYKQGGIDLTSINGKNGNVLPVPAVYIVDPKGKIVFKYFNNNYKQRVSVAELIAQL